MGRRRAVDSDGRQGRVKARGSRGRHRKSRAQPGSSSPENGEHRSHIGWLEMGWQIRLIALLAFSASLLAQGRGQPPASPRAAAPADFTGAWVSVITEDWRWRMVTPARGDFASIPLNAEG